MSRKIKQKNKVALKKKLDLKMDFPPSSYEKWKEAAISDLRGKSFKGELFTETDEKIILKPIYTQSNIKNVDQVRSFPGNEPYVRGTKADGYMVKSWDICQEIPAFSAEEFNTSLKHDLLGGQTAVLLLPDRAFQLGKDPDDAVSDDIGQGGISISQLDDFCSALAGIDIQKYPLYIDPGFSSLTIMMMLVAYTEKYKINTKNIRAYIGGDPLGFLVREGMLPAPLNRVFDHMKWSVCWAKTHFPKMRAVGVNSAPYHNSGAHVVQELAFAVASGVEYINCLQNRNLNIDEIAQSIHFSFCTGSFFFMEIAKYRAAKALWSKIVKEYGGSSESQKINIHARTSTYNKCVYDPYVNMLRATTESLSAIIGGVNSLHTSAFNESFTYPDEFSRRIARNTQLILEKEVHLRNPIDPAGGSYYIEALTAEVAEKAWDLFQEIEKMGGMLKAIQQEFPQNKIAEVAARKKKDIASRKSILVGTNMYANAEEKNSHYPETLGEELKVRRCEAFKKFKHSRDVKSLTQGLKKFTRAIETGDKEIMTAGSEALLKGATVEDIAELLFPEPKESVHIKKLNIHRLAEPFETTRSNGVDRT
jgi:methylmalonyl-CoA mutase